MSTSRKRSHSSTLASPSASRAASDLLDTITPLVLTRTEGFLSRPKPMPPPFGAARIPNAIPSLDRLSIEIFPRLNALRTTWTADVAARTLSTCLIATQLDLKYTLRLFASHSHLLETFAVEEMCALFTEWADEGAEKGNRKLFRGRFQTVDLPTLIRLLREWKRVDVPDVGMAAFGKWLRSFRGIGPLHSMVITRELRLYGFFPGDEAIQLGKGQGSYKLLAEAGVPAGEMEGTIREMQAGFKDRMEEVVASRGVGSDAISALLLRTPTFLEVENMCCEIRKMIKVEKGGKAKKFKGAANEPPPKAVPLTTMRDGVVSVEVVNLA